jgi:hypothetical protein
MIGGSFEIITQGADKWECPICGVSNLFGQISCKKCKGFRPLDSYPNLLHNPRQATEAEIADLDSRRKLEFEMLTTKDSIEISDIFYLIN